MKHHDKPFCETRSSQKIQQKLETFIDAVPVHFGFLKDLEYEGPRVIRHEDELLGFWVTLFFQSEKARREVHLDLVPIHKGDPSKETLGLSLWRVPAPPGAYSRDNHIELDMLLKEYRPDLDQTRLDIRSYKGSFPERLSAVLDLYASLLKSEALEVLIGDRWETGLYPELY